MGLELLKASRRGKSPKEDEGSPARDEEKRKCTGKMALHLQMSPDPPLQSHEA